MLLRNHLMFRQFPKSAESRRRRRLFVSVELYHKFCLSPWLRAELAGYHWRSCHKNDDSSAVIPSSGADTIVIRTTVGSSARTGIVRCRPQQLEARPAYRERD